MSIPPGLKPIDLIEWTNRHENFKVKLTRGASFDMSLPFPIEKQAENYHATTKNFQWLIKNALEQGTTLRAMGAGWSFTDVAVCTGGIVDTRDLRTFFSIGKSFLDSTYLAKGNSPDNLVFTQCGMSVLQLSKELEEENDWNKCIKASGASNGQTIAGAIATGTHGAAVHVGAIHDTVAGLHIVTGPDSHVWVERASNPVASSDFIKWLGADLIRDDDVFNSALVSFGSFGFIHGLLLEVEPKFLLKKRSTGMIAFDMNVQKAIEEADFSIVDQIFPDKTGELYHFEVIVNPHVFEDNDPKKGVYIKALFKNPFRTGYPPMPASPDFEYGDDVLGLIETVLASLGDNIREHLIPRLVTKLLPLMYTSDENSEGTIGDMFGYTKIKGKAASAAIGIDHKHSTTAIREIVALNKRHPFAGVLALRFVKGTAATLGFTKFPISCVLEMDGVDSDLNRQFFDKVWNRFEELNIPYTLHWGKINHNLNPKRLVAMYGQDQVNKWKSSRARLLTPEVQAVFTNKFLERCGLDLYLPVSPLIV
jgi:hypothetical protein